MRYFGAAAAAPALSKRFRAAVHIFASSALLKTRSNVRLGLISDSDRAMSSADGVTVCFRNTSVVCSA